MSITKILIERRQEIKDPRPDLKEDSQLWQDFLIIARARWGVEDPDFWWLLHGFRCMGTRLVKNQSGGYILRPLVDERLGFQEGEYETMRDKYLKPHVNRVKELLEMLERKERAAV